MGGYWIDIPQPPCNAPCTGECGGNGFACELGAICMTFIDKVTSYSCIPMPCQGPLTCGCAEPFCNEQGLKCNNIQDGYKVLRCGARARSHRS
jgi:hypothetical protein